jgi:hypothetical protein
MKLHLLSRQNSQPHNHNVDADADAPPNHSYHHHDRDSHRILPSSVLPSPIAPAFAPSLSIGTHNLAPHHKIIGGSISITQHQ